LNAHVSESTVLSLPPDMHGYLTDITFEKRKRKYVHKQAKMESQINVP